MNAKHTLILGAAAAGLVVFSVQNANKFTCDTSAPHTVTHGDTLWSIAERNCEGNVGNAVDHLTDAYGHPGTLRVGTVIYLPANQDCALTVTGAGEVFEDCR